MAKQDHKKLRSKDVSERKAAIRAVAKAKDRNALKQLAKMAGDDPDKQIRKLAKQAGIYIRQQLGEIEGDAEPEKDGKKPRKLYVDPKDEQKAKQAVDAAMSANINGEKARCIKLLGKAVQLDPNLRVDGFVVSLAEQATGLHGEDAINALEDSEQVVEAERKETMARESATAEEHMAEISKAQWSDVAFDFGLLAVIATLGAIVALFLATQQAQSFYTSYEANMEQYEELYNASAFARTDAGALISQDCPNPSPTFNYIQPAGAVVVVERGATVTDRDVVMNNPECNFYDGSAYWGPNEYWRDLGTARVIINGLMIGLGITALTMAMAWIVHFLGDTVFRGEGRIQHYAHVAGTLVASRSLFMAIICCVAAVLYFSSGSMAELLLGIIGIYFGITLFMLIGKTTSAYRLNGAMGALATIIAVAAVGVAGAAGAFVLL